MPALVLPGAAWCCLEAQKAKVEEINVLLLCLCAYGGSWLGSKWEWRP